MFAGPLSLSLSLSLRDFSIVYLFERFPLQTCDVMPPPKIYSPSKSFYMKIPIPPPKKKQKQNKTQFYSARCLRYALVYYDINIISCINIRRARSILLSEIAISGFGCTLQKYDIAEYKNDGVSD